VPACCARQVSASFEEKETSVLALTLALFQYPERTKVATGLATLYVIFTKALYLNSTHSAERELYFLYNVMKYNLSL
jgi:hypothetical protein